MPGWTNDELSRIDSAMDLDLASVRHEGTLRRPVTMWVVRHGDEIYDRSVNGRGLFMHLYEPQKLKLKSRVRTCSGQFHRFKRARFVRGNRSR